MSWFDQQTLSASALGSAGPMIFSATNALLLKAFDDVGASLWSADIHATRSGGVTCDFGGVLFLESDARASIYGISVDDGSRNIHPPEIGEPQEAFIQFLRQETALESRLLGPLKGLFGGNEYSCELRATTAYLLLRKSSLKAGIGFFDASGEYQRLTIDLENG